MPNCRDGILNTFSRSENRVNHLKQPVRIRTVHVKAAVAAIDGYLVPVELTSLSSLNRSDELILKLIQRTQISLPVGEVNYDCLLRHDDA